ncbi:MAG: MFS transporter [Patescibacteria group bacterium]
MKYLVHAIQTRGLIFLVYLSNFFLSFHYFTTAYVNSSFLGNNIPQAIADHLISGLYILASILNIFIFLYAPELLRHIGNYKLALWLSVLDLLAVWGLAYTTDIAYILPLFVIHQAIVPVILFNLDIFLEHCTKDENLTGEFRGLFLTVTNVALVISPLLLAAIGLSKGDFSPAYLLSGMFLVPFILIIGFTLRSFEDPHYHPLQLQHEIDVFIKNRNINSVFIANFILQLFYSWMVIYMPLYLINTVGLSWEQFGLMLTIALLPFALFELPIGTLADKKFGEKEIMAFGFIITAASLFAISYFDDLRLSVLTLLLFLSRTGAAFIEITTESYFFKKTKESDADLVSTFRISRPFSYVVGPLLGGFTLLFLPYQHMFSILGLVMVCGLFFVFRITDTR